MALQIVYAAAIHSTSCYMNDRLQVITADTDLRLARYLGMSEGFFLGLQADHDLMKRRRMIGKDLAAIEPRAA
jgi:plasmid maintenance system antidote protein VapI